MRGGNEWRQKKRRGKRIETGGKAEKGETEKGRLKGREEEGEKEAKENGKKTKKGRKRGGDNTEIRRRMR